MKSSAFTYDQQQQTDLKKSSDKFHSIWLGDNLKLWQYIFFGELVMTAIFFMYNTVCTVIKTQKTYFSPFLSIFDSDNLFFVFMVVTT